MTEYVLEVWSVRRFRAWRRGLMQPIWQVVSSIRPLQFFFETEDRTSMTKYVVGVLECTSLSGLASRTYAADMASHD